MNLAVVCKISHRCRTAARRSADLLIPAPKLTPLSLFLLLLCASSVFQASWTRPDTYEVWLLLAVARL